MVGPFLDRDLKACYSHKEFGETVVIDGRKFDAVYDDEDIEVSEEGSHSATIMRQPSINCVLKGLPTLQNGMAVTVRDVQHSILNWKVEGDGTVTIYLKGL